MTENKRFTLHKGFDTLNIMDNTKFNEHIYINKSSKDMELLVGVLNELWEELVELKNKQIKSIEENEQLKSEKEHYKKQVDELDGLLNKYEITFEELEEILGNDYRERF